MRRSRIALLIAGLAALFASSDASAQARIHLGGGATFPMRDYSGYANPGWIALGGVAFPIGGAGLAVGAVGYFGANHHEPPPDGDKTNLYGGLSFVQYTLGDGTAASPFVFGAAGLMAQDYRSETQPALEGSRTGIAAGGGAGVTFPLGGVGAFAEAWVLNGFFDGGNTTIAGLAAGLQLAIGG